MITAVYTTTDGTKFTSYHEAEKYEAKGNKSLNILMSLLKAPDRIESEEYVQHEKDVADFVVNSLLRMIIQDCADDEVVVRFAKETLEKGLANAHPSYVDRFLGETNKVALASAWGRICRINWHNYREYQQIYYANNPDRATKEVKV